MKRHLLLVSVIASLLAVPHQGVNATPLAADNNFSAAPSTSARPGTTPAKRGPLAHLHRTRHAQGVLQTFVVAANAKIHLGTKTTGTLADLRTGERVGIAYDATGGGALLAHKIHLVLPHVPNQPHSPSAQPHKPTNELHVEGVIHAINLKAGTLTIAEHRHHA